MPKITNYKPKRHRAWDDNILDSLTMKIEELESNKGSDRVQLESNKGSDRVQLESNKGSDRVQLESNKGSDRVQLESNKGSDRVQLESNKGSDRVQLESNKGSDRVQLESNKGSDRVQLESNKGSDRVQLESNKGSDRVQLESKLVIDVLPRIPKNEKNILIALLEKMIANNSNDTEYLNSKELVETAKTTTNGLKTGLKRLCNKGLIHRESGKRGEGGFIRFTTTTGIKNKLIQFFLQNVSYCNKGSEKKAVSSYNSNTTMIDKYKEESVQNLASPENTNELIANLQKENDSLKKLLLSSGLSPAPTTPTPQSTPATSEPTTEPTQQNLDDWDSIDFSALEPHGFRKCKIKEIRNCNTDLTPQDVQNSIEHYAWALQNRPEEMKSYASEKNKIRGLMGVLRKGNIWDEPGYKSPEDLAMEAQRNAKKRRLERINKQKEEDLEDDYQLWRAEMSDEEYKQMRAALPSICQGQKDDNKIVQSAIKNYFKENIHKKGER